MTPTNIKLIGYSGTKYTSKKNYILSIKYKNRAYILLVIVVPREVTPILSLATFEKMNLVKSVPTVKEDRTLILPGDHFGC